MLNIIVEKYFGEFEADRIIRETFFPDWSFKGIMVEVGAAEPQYLSMSAHFRLNGWRCICVEPNPWYADAHLKRGHEIAPVACGAEDLENQDFEIMEQPLDFDPKLATAFSLSALKIREDYVGKDPPRPNSKLRRCKVNVRKLDTLMAKVGISEVNLLTVDVEGWELEVMRGFSLEKFKPRVVMLENYLKSGDYEKYMCDRGYVLRFKIEHNDVFAAVT